MSQDSIESSIQRQRRRLQIIAGLSDKQAKEAYIKLFISDQELLRLLKKHCPKFPEFFVALCEHSEKGGVDAVFAAQFRAIDTSLPISPEIEAAYQRALSGLTWEELVKPAAPVPRADEKKKGSPAAPPRQEAPKLFLDLHAAIKEGRFSRKLLQAHLGQINTPDSDGITPCDLAIVCDQNATLSALIEAGANIHQGIYGSALIFAIKLKKVAVARLLLERASKTDKQRQLSFVTSEGYTPLQTAVLEDDAETVKALLQHGADVGKQNADGMTALYIAAQQGSAAVCRILLTAKTKPPDFVNLATTQKGTPLHVAASLGHDKVVEQLLEAKADAFRGDKDGCNALHHAADQTGDLTKRAGIHLVCRRLAGIPLLVNTQNHRGHAALYIAARWGDDALVTLLLAAKADPFQIDEEGNTALHEATKAARIPICKRLAAIPGLGNIRNERGETALHLAVSQGHYELVELLLDKVNPSRKDNEGNTALHIAMIKNRIQICQRLLAISGLINKKNKRGLTALHYAVMDGLDNLIVTLIRAGADPSIEDADGSTPVHFAVALGKADTLRVLLEEGADGRQLMKNGLSALYIAAEMGHVALCRILVDKYPSLVHQTFSKKNNSALQVAAELGHEAVVELLLGAGADPFQQDAGGNNALHTAASNKQLSVCRKLVTIPGLVNTKNTQNITPLFMAIGNDQDELVTLLLQAKAYPAITSSDGESALFMAATKGSLGICQILWKAEPDLLDQVDSRGRTPLMIAAYNNHIAVMRFLIEQQVNLFRQSYLGHHALHYAAFGGKLEPCELLLAEASGLLHAVDNQYSAPLYIAAKQGHEDIVELFLQRGAIAGQVDEMGYTALHIAANKGHLGVLEKLLKSDPSLLSVSGLFGTSAFHVAIISQQVDCVKMFARVSSADPGFDINASNERGVSLLQFAVLFETSLDVLNVLLGIKGIAINQLLRGRTILDMAETSENRGMAEFLRLKGAKKAVELSHDDVGAAVTIAGDATATTAATPSPLRKILVQDRRRPRRDSKSDTTSSESDTSSSDDEAGLKKYCRQVKTIFLKAQDAQWLMDIRKDLRDKGRRKSQSADWLSNPMTFYGGQAAAEAKGAKAAAQLSSEDLVDLEQCGFYYLGYFSAGPGPASGKHRFARVNPDVIRQMGRDAWLRIEERLRGGRVGKHREPLVSCTEAFALSLHRDDHLVGIHQDSYQESLILVSGQKLDVSVEIYSGYAAKHGELDSVARGLLKKGRGFEM